jgi:hypothetical protein
MAELSQWIMAVKVLAPIILTLSLVCLVVAQEKITSRIPNLPRIAKAWNSLAEQTEIWNKNTARAEALLHARFDGQVLDLNEERRAKLEEERRKACVGYYKQAREALLKQVDALNVLIETEDY